jgi:hypothetical protein
VNPLCQQNLVGAVHVAYIYLLGRWVGETFHYTDVGHLVTDDMRAECAKAGLRIYRYPEGELGLRGGYSGCGIDDRCSNTILRTSLQYTEIAARPDNIGFLPEYQHTFNTKYHSKRFRIEKRLSGDPECEEFNRAAGEAAYVNDTGYCLVAKRIDEFTAAQSYESGVYAEPVMESELARLIYRGSRIRDTASGEVLIEWRDYRVVAKSKRGYFESPACGSLPQKDIIRILYAAESERMPLTKRD